MRFRLTILVALIVAFLIPHGFGIIRLTTNGIQANMLRFNWFGYELGFAFTYKDARRGYRAMVDELLEHYGDD